MKVGPSKYSQGGEIVFARYAHDKTISIEIVDDVTGEPEAKATVCLEQTPPPANHVWLKGWSENEGIPEALEEAGICVLTGETKQTGFVEAQLATLCIDALDEIKRLGI